MKIRSLSIQNFKGVRSFEASFLDCDGKERPLTAIFGDNCSGKTTVLQAIALVLSLATRRTGKVSDFRWPGFLPHRMASLGPTRVELEVILDDEEVQTTSDLFLKWQATRPTDFRQSKAIVSPSTHRRLTLTYDAEGLRCDQGFEGLVQFLGRYYVKGILDTNRNARERFAQVGDVFWFDQYRNLGSARPQRPSNGQKDTNEPGEWQAGVEALREFLLSMWAYHTSEAKTGGRDYIPDFERLLSEVFPGLLFRGVAPRAETDESKPAANYDILLELEGRVYDIAEMSSGEQAVFALVYDFVRLQMSKSIVLVDELELHLHPPEQQSLLGALRLFGPNCQFFVTSHSDYLSDIVPTEHTVWLRRSKV